MTVIKRAVDTKKSNFVSNIKNEPFIKIASPSIRFIIIEALSVDAYRKEVKKIRQSL